MTALTPRISCVLRNCGMHCREDIHHACRSHTRLGLTVMSNPSLLSTDPLNQSCSSCRVCCINPRLPPPHNMLYLLPTPHPFIKAHRPDKVTPRGVPTPPPPSLQLDGASPRLKLVADESTGSILTRRRSGKTLAPAVATPALSTPPASEVH